jgi:3',5'-nucleoside bisphosphate phosphatase
MLYADLHIHSTFSDGELTPSEILNTAMLKGIKCISITDHDTIMSQYQLEPYFCESNPIIIPGLEISTEYCDCEIHFLAYFIDIYNQPLVETLSRIREARVGRFKDIIKELYKLDIHILPDDIDKQEDVSIGRPHIARLLVQKGYACSIKEAFHQFLAKGKPAYVERYKINYKEALKLIAEAGGVAVLAHPAEVYKGLSTEKLIKEFKVYGLRGVEVFHPSHSNMEISKFYNLAKKYDLVITGGSDFHSSIDNGTVSIGLTGLNETLTDKLLRRNRNK